MNIGKDDIALGGVILTIIYNIFGFGRKVQSAEDKADKNSEDITAIKKLFVTDNGDPRLISVVVCGAKQEACQALAEERHNTVMSAISELKEDRNNKLDTIYDYVKSK